MEQKEDLPTNQENKVEMAKEEQENTEEKKNSFKKYKKISKKNIS